MTYTFVSYEQLALKLMELVGDQNQWEDIVTAVKRGTEEGDIIHIQYHSSDYYFSKFTGQLDTDYVSNEKRVMM